MMKAINEYNIFLTNSFLLPNLKYRCLCYLMFDTVNIDRLKPDLFFLKLNCNQIKILLLRLR